MPAKPSHAYRHEFLVRQRKELAARHHFRIQRVPHHDEHGPAERRTVPLPRRVVQEIAHAHTLALDDLAHVAQQEQVDHRHGQIQHVGHIAEQRLRAHHNGQRQHADLERYLQDLDQRVRIVDGLHAVAAVVDALVQPDAIAQHLVQLIFQCRVVRLLGAGAAEMGMMRTEGARRIDVHTFCADRNGTSRPARWYRDTRGCTGRILRSAWSAAELCGFDYWS